MKSSQIRSKPSSVQGTARAKSNDILAVPPRLPASGGYRQCDSPEPLLGVGPACLQGSKSFLGLVLALPWLQASTHGSTMNESPDPIPSSPQGQGPPLFPKLVGGTSRDRSELRRESWGRCGLAGAPASKSFLPAEPPQGFWGAAASLGSGKFPLRGGKGMGIIHRLA